MVEIIIYSFTTDSAAEVEPDVAEDAPSIADFPVTTLNAYALNYAYAIPCTIHCNQNTFYFFKIFF